MTPEQYHRSDAVDLLTIILCFPLCIWLGWWGILAAFGVGLTINIICAKYEESKP